MSLRIVHLFVLTEFLIVRGNNDPLCAYQLSFPCSMNAHVSSDMADYIYSHPGQLDLQLQGIWIGDRQFLPLHGCVLHRADVSFST
jgi:hypothetical protein